MKGENMKKLLVLFAVFVLVLGARMNSSQAFSLLPASAGADPDKVLFGITGVSKALDTTIQPDDALFGGFFTDGVDPLIDHLIPLSGSVATGDAIYGETWGVAKVQVITDDQGFTLWPGVATDEDIYMFYYGLYDSSITEDPAGNFNIGSVGGFYQMWLSSDVDDTDGKGVKSAIDLTAR